MGCHFLLQCMKVKSESEVAQLWPTLSDLMDCCLPGSSIHGVFQARVLEWGAIAFSTIMPSRAQLYPFKDVPYLFLASSPRPISSLSAIRMVSSAYLRLLIFLPEILIPACASSRRRQWHLTSVLLPGKSHGWRSLVGSSPWGR